MRNIILGIILFVSFGFAMYQAVRTDITLTGEGITGAELKVDTTKIATRYYIDANRGTATYLSSDATANATTTGVAITGMNRALTAGSYVFTYYIRYHSSATSCGIRFGVNYTGTATMFMANLRLQESTTAASTGAASQAATGTDMKLVTGSSCRAESTTTPNLNLTISVDASNSDMMAIIEGMMIVSDGGDIELWHASEVATSTTVKEGTTLIITKVN